MKLLHCADLHLGSRLTSRMPGEKAAERRRELLYGFERIASLAKAEGVRLCLIAGDLFDSPNPPPSLVSSVLEVIRQQGETDFLLLYGNHAGGFRIPSADLPPNLKTFGEGRYTAYRYGEVTIFGSENPMAELPELSPLGLNIVMLHGGMIPSGEPGKDEFPLSAVSHAHIDYLALGHYHSYRMGRLPSGGLYAYPGIPEPRGFDETGDGGIILLEAGERRITPRFCRIASRRYHDLPLDISGVKSHGECLERLEAGIAACRPEDALRVTLVGSLGASYSPDLTRLAHAEEANFFYFELHDATKLEIKAEEVEHDLSLSGEFVRTVRARGLAPELENLTLRAGLAALAGEEVLL